MPKYSIQLSSLPDAARAEEQLLESVSVEQRVDRGFRKHQHSNVGFPACDCRLHGAAVCSERTAFRIGFDFQYSQQREERNNNKSDDMDGRLNE